MTGFRSIGADVRQYLEPDEPDPPLDQTVITGGSISNQIDPIYLEKKRTYVKLPQTLIGRPAYVSKLSVIISVAIILLSFACDAN
jgi:hypothetical protein